MAETLDKKPKNRLSHLKNTSTILNGLKKRSLNRDLNPVSRETNANDLQQPQYLYESANDNLQPEINEQGTAIEPRQETTATMFQQAGKIAQQGTTDGTEPQTVQQYQNTPNLREVNPETDNKFTKTITNEADNILKEYAFKNNPQAYEDLKSTFTQIGDNWKSVQEDFNNNNLGTGTLKLLNTAFETVSAPFPVADAILKQNPSTKLIADGVNYLFENADNLINIATDLEKGAGKEVLKTLGIDTDFLDSEGMEQFNLLRKNIAYIVGGEVGIKGFKQGIKPLAEKLGIDTRPTTIKTTETELNKLREVTETGKFNGRDLNMQEMTELMNEISTREKFIKQYNETFKKEVVDETTVPTNTVENKPVDQKYYRYETDGAKDTGVKFYSKQKDYVDEYKTVREQNGKTGKIVEENIELKNPLVVEAQPREFSDPTFESKYIKQAIENGNDGVVFRNGQDEFVARITKPTEKPIEQVPLDKLELSKQVESVDKDLAEVIKNGELSPDELKVIQENLPKDIVANDLQKPIESKSTLERVDTQGKNKYQYTDENGDMWEAKASSKSKTSKFDIYKNGEKQSVGANRISDIEQTIEVIKEAEQSANSFEGLQKWEKSGRFGEATQDFRGLQVSIDPYGYQKAGTQKKGYTMTISQKNSDGSLTILKQIQKEGDSFAKGKSEAFNQVKPLVEEQFTKIGEKLSRGEKLNYQEREFYKHFKEPIDKQSNIKPESYNQAVKNLKDRTNQINSNPFDPTVFKDIYTIGKFHLESGLKNFTEWGRKIIADIGSWIKPHLQKLWTEINKDRTGLKDVKVMGADFDKILDMMKNKKMIDEKAVNDIKVKMRGTAKRMSESSEFKDIADQIKSDPESYYEQQNIASSKEALEKLSDAELVEKMKDTDLPLQDTETNVGILARLEQFNRMRERGEDTSAVLRDLYKQGTSMGQLIRQFAELKTSTKEGLVALFEKRLDKDGYSINENQRKNLIGLADNYLKADKNLRQKFTEYEITPTTEILKEVKRLENIKHREEQNLGKKFGDLTPRSLADTFIGIIQGNLLTPMSQVTNIWGNSFKAPLQFSNKIVATTADLLNYAIRNKVLGNKNVVRNTTINPRIVGDYFKGFGEGFVQSLKDIAKGDNDINLEKFEIKRGFRPLRVWVDIFSKDMPTKNGKIPVKDYVNKITEGLFGIPPEIMFRLLNVGDKPFRTAMQRATSTELGQVRGLKGGELNKFKLSPDKKAQEIIRKESERSVFAQDNKFADWFNSLFRLAGDIPAVGGFIKFMGKVNFPYTKFPLNYITEVVDYVAPPVALAKSLHYAKNGDKRLAQENLGKAVTGTMMYSVAKILSDNNIISGDADDKGKVRSFEYSTKPSNSINLSALKRFINGESTAWKSGDDIVDYNKMGIFGAVFNVHANTKERNDAKKPEERSTLSDIMGMLPTASQFAINQSFLKGTSSALDALQDKTGNKIDKWLENMFNVVASVPLPNTLNAIQRSREEYLPQTKGDDLTETLGNLIKAKTFNTKDLPIRVNMWGNKIKRTPEGANPIAYQLFDVSKYKNIEDDKVTQELYKMYTETNNADVLPPEVQGSFTEKKQTYKLNVRDKIEFETVVGEERRKAIETLLDSTEYKNADTEDKITKIKSAYSKGGAIGKKKYTDKKGITKPD